SSRSSARAPPTRRCSLSGNSREGADSSKMSTDQVPISSTLNECNSRSNGLSKNFLLRWGSAEAWYRYLPDHLASGDARYSTIVDAALDIGHPRAIGGRPRRPLPAV